MFLREICLPPVRLILLHEVKVNMKRKRREIYVRGKGYRFMTVTERFESNLQKSFFYTSDSSQRFFSLGQVYDFL